MPKLLFFIDYEYVTHAKPSFTPGILHLINLLLKENIKVDLALDSRSLLEKVEKEEFDAACFSTLTLNLEKCLNLATKIKELKPGTITVFGGYGVYTIYDKIVYHKAVDIAVESEAENTFPPLAKILQKKRKEPPLTCKDKEIIYNLYFTRKIEFNGEQYLLAIPLSKIAFKTREGVYVLKVFDIERLKLFYSKTISLNPGKPVIGFKEYLKHVRPEPTSSEIDEKYEIPWDLVVKYGWRDLNLYTQRGCPWGRCIFCSIYRTPLRYMSINKIVKIIEDAVKNGLKSVCFTDDVFTADRERVLKLCRKIRERQLHKKIFFTCETRGDMLDEELIEELSITNFKNIGLGVETFIPFKAEYLGKCFNGLKYVEKCKNSIRLCIEHNVMPVVFLIVVTHKSTLLEIARELYETSKYLKELYDKYGITFYAEFQTLLQVYLGSPLANMTKYFSKRKIGEIMLEIPARLLLNEKVNRFVEKMIPIERLIYARKEKSFLNYISEACELLEKLSQDTRCEEVIKKYVYETRRLISKMYVIQLDDYVLFIKL